MTGNFYMVQIPATVPARFLRHGHDTYVVYAASSADALSMVQSHNLSVKAWASAVVTLLPTTPDMLNWSLRVTLWNAASPSVIVFDKTVTNVSGTADASASATVTFSSTGLATNDTITVNDVTIKAVASGAVGAEQINTSGVAATDATHLAALINAYPDTFECSAAAVSAVVTLTALVAGPTGNDITLSKSSTNTAVSAAALAGGTSANDLNALAALMVTALNASTNPAISHAAYSAPTLTIAGSADNIGNYTAQVTLIPPSVLSAANAPNTSDSAADYYQNDYANTAGVATISLGVPSMVGTITSGGSAGSAITAVLAADDYPIPSLIFGGSSTP